MKLKFSEATEIVEIGPGEFIVRPKAEAIIAAAIAVVEERYRGSTWVDLSEKIGLLADALKKCGHGDDWEFYA